MPERKSHVKSRLGCSQCKSRRVKCDEVRPTCGNCKRRQESCSYKNANPVTTSPSPDASSTTDGSSGIPGTERLKQLELMHQYCTSTYETISLGPRPGATQLIEVPRLAFAHEFLLDTVFAMTCLHLAYLNPTEAHVHIADAMRYHSRALVSYRQRLENLQASECRALYHTSAKLGLIPLALRAVDEETAKAQRPTETLIQLSSLWRGTTLVLNATKELIDPMTYEVMFPYPDWDNRLHKSFNDNSQKFLDFLRERAKGGEFLPNGHASSKIDDEYDDDDECMTDTPTTTAPINDHDPSAVYIDAIDQLQGLYQAVRLEKSRILAWLVFIPPQFHEYLSQQQPLAMAIILMYSVFIRDFEAHWWAKEFHGELLKEVVPVVAGLGVEFAEMAEWARTVLREVVAVEI
ncbi:hypothetical protein M409DRAFT_62310 [Zasmidium cellare ATCC 36951]|uniref:Zn(2)-C6 fungal-type domain-containing protein n=1 Tax=Zasmidium cellare ATCC 36951 TaxID=1080233 RepID=A0A6A6D446_ZASCE|nr:uncharacterized protein M409DRAFT_62310 [Zasmidium cellare ATCC 36951]KAF2174194.1 hypothetical protein M409DRAFT_62310 [Zasmidium cellare ATCC 36951]